MLQSKTSFLDALLAPILPLLLVIGAASCDTRTVSAHAPTGITKVAVTGYETGLGKGADNRVREVKTRFAPGEAILISVFTEGVAPSADLTVIWEDANGETISEETKTIVPTGPAATPFTLMRPEGLVPGRYHAMILLDGVQADKAEVAVY